MRFLLQIVVIVCATATCSAETEISQSPIKVEIVKTEVGYQLLRGGEPYVIHGAGMGIDDIRRFASHGGNSIRNWTTTGEYQDTQALLDSAHANGVTVALCLSMEVEHWGFDYDDAEAVAEQFERMRAEVLKYRDHPALLVWIIGNELNFDYTNPKVYDAVNDLSRMIHDVDTNHPTTTTITGVHNSESLLEDIAKRAPDLDFLSFQVYKELEILPRVIEEIGFEQPFFITEWGAVGFWEADQTAWGAPIEATSTEKAQYFLNGYRNKIEPLEDRLIGSYVFMWGQKQERTPTWFGVFTESGEETEAVDVMQNAWTGSWPDNRAPQVNSIFLGGRNAHDNITITAGGTYDVSFQVTDPDDDALAYRWELKPESSSQSVGGKFEQAIGSLGGYIVNPSAAKTRITVPGPGAYRLFAYANDGHGSAAHANIPFLVVTPPTAGQRPEDLVAGEIMAVGYSGFRAGQHPDRGMGAVNPSDAEILQDLEILLAHDFNLIRMYDTGENTRATLELIRQHDLPIKVLLGIWLRAELSNHEGCPWLDEPIPEAELAANTVKNAAELKRGIELAHEFDDIVVAVNVGNEALVEWNDHMVSPEQVIGYVRQVKEAIHQPVTVAENYAWWIKDGAPLAAEVDFVGIHTYPVWEDRTIDEALAYTLENIEGVRAALPDKRIAILEAGCAAAAAQFGDRAS